MKLLNWRFGGHREIIELEIWWSPWNYWIPATGSRSWGLKSKHLFYHSVVSIQFSHVHPIQSCPSNSLVSIQFTRVRPIQSYIHSSNSVMEQSAVPKLHSISRLPLFKTPWVHPITSMQYKGSNVGFRPPNTMGVFAEIILLSMNVFQHSAWCVQYSRFIPFMHCPPSSP